MKQSKKMLAIALLVLLIIFRPQPVSAMHIMEGYLPLVWCIVWFLLFLPFFIFGLIKLRRLFQKIQIQKPCWPCPVPLSLSYLP